MESSEDDAGAASSASRRASAREKDVGLSEELDGSRHFQHESSDTRASCGTPAMSEDNFDGDSVPSPSVQNTSTEAILDMIDEIVDGPGAPRRIPRVSEEVGEEEATDRASTPAPESQHNKDSEVIEDQITVEPRESSRPATSGNSESGIASVPIQVAESECTPNSEILICAPVGPSEETVQICSEDVSVSENPSTEGISLVSSVKSGEPEPLLGPSVSAPSSSIETVQTIVNTSECENNERTVKCVASSENRDNVTVEIAESTSSDCSSVSESKGNVETVSRSPLKRRLIRPVPSDRRPDSTVSSTADSQTVEIHTHETVATSEPVTKDVSSSSDAVLTVHGNVKPEEISNVSEISICKAETSTAPPRKIKLVRPKLTPVMSSSVKTDKQSSELIERNVCESTSSDDSSNTSSIPKAETSSPSLPCKETRTEDCENALKQQTIETPDIVKNVSLKSLLSYEDKPTAEPSSSTNQQKVNEFLEKPLCHQEDLKPNLLDETSVVNQCSVAETLSSNVEIEKAETQSSERLSVEELPQRETQNSETDKISKEVSLGSDEPAEIIKSDVEKQKSGSLEFGLEKVQNKSDAPMVEKSSDCPTVEKIVMENMSTKLELVTDLEPEKTIDIVKETTSMETQEAPNTKVTEVPCDKSSDIETPKCEMHSESNVEVNKEDIQSSGSTNIETPKVQDIQSIDSTGGKIMKAETQIDKESLEVKKVPPIKLNLSAVKPESKTNLNNLDSQSSSNCDRPNSKEDMSDSSTTYAKDAQSDLSLFNCEEEHSSSVEQTTNCDAKMDIKKVPPIKLNLSTVEHNKISEPSCTYQKTFANEEMTTPCQKSEESTKQVPKLTIKLSHKLTEEPKSPVPKLTIKPIRPPVEENIASHEVNEQIPSVTKINIKPIPKPSEKVIDSMIEPQPVSHQNDLSSKNEQIPNITKLNIKPIPRPPEKVNEVHRKSSSSEISESECSENDETSTSDQASASEQGPSDTVPKVTIKLGKPGTESEGKFYTESNVPKLTIKNIHSDKDELESTLKMVISQSEDAPVEKIPKLTIKTITKSDGQPLSPKLTIKPLKPPENTGRENEIPKLKISSKDCTESYSSSMEVKENIHVPKITIKPVTKTDTESGPKTPKKSSLASESSDHIPVVTKLNIKPILKPTESCGESSEYYEEEKVPVVSKLNIKPIVKPKNNEVDNSLEDIPKKLKLNIKPLKNPEECSSEEKDCDVINADKKNSSIPVVTKLNIKPIIKPEEDESLKDSENQSSETGNSSDDNADHIPVVTKLNIKPILKPSELEESSKSEHNEQSIPVVTKLNIKPLVKPEDSPSPSSPKKDSSKMSGSIPIVTKLNIKPIVKPDESPKRTEEENTEKSKNPPLVMVINMKNLSENIQDKEHISNNVSGTAHSPNTSISTKGLKTTLMEHSPRTRSSQKQINIDGGPRLDSKDAMKSIENAFDDKIVPESLNQSSAKEPQSPAKEQFLLKLATDVTPVPDNSALNTCNTEESIPIGDHKPNRKNANQMNSVHENFLSEQLNSSSTFTEAKMSPGSTRHKKSIMQNCTLLKKLLSGTKDDEEKNLLNQSNCSSPITKAETLMSICNDSEGNEQDSGSEKLNSLKPQELNRKNSQLRHISETLKMRSIHDVHREANESVTKPLEISITEKPTNQISGQDSPRIILKINKTDHGASSKIITEDIHKPSHSSPSNENETATQAVNDVPSPKKQLNSRRKHGIQESPTNLTMGKRLRSSRIVESAEISPTKRNADKRPSVSETDNSPPNKSTELSDLEAKRMKLEQLLSANKSLTITPVISKNAQMSPEKSGSTFDQDKKAVSHNHSLLNNENCPQKNGNSKLHNILSNLQAKQMHSLHITETSAAEKTIEVESNTSTGSSDVVVEITRIDNCHPEEMLINENSVCDLTETDDISQDPLEVENAKPAPEEVVETPILMTPTPRKRGRPRKQPLSESAKPPPPPTSPVPVPPSTAERPQRSLRLLMRDRPAILTKPRGRGGRGRGGRRAAPVVEPEAEVLTVVEIEERVQSPIDPTSSRIKLPRMTEALDKACTTPLSSRRRSSSPQLNLFEGESPVKDEAMKTPEVRGRGGRGSRGGLRGRTPRARGRGRGGGRGAMYMKETMGIYGRVCGPATTTVQLFEEETCMMDDNATPKPSHLLDEDSQSSVKSSTNDSSNKMKKSKFADLFDSNKVWTAADVKEYSWPSPDSPNSEPQVMMIQEQVAMFLGVKSFKRRYPELKRRTVGGAEREYVLSKGLVSEALCDLGITAVEASEVLDIMLSDYPHKYEEYRAHQRQRQLTEVPEEPTEPKVEEAKVKVEVKQDKTSDKPEPKVDPEKTRQDMAAAAIASASEWNARANAWRKPACVDLQTMTVHRRRAPLPAPGPCRVRPPLGFYPLALLPGQYQHGYRTYTAEQLRYFPLNTVLAAPPAPPSPAESSSDSDGSWGDGTTSSDDSDAHHHPAKRKKLTKTKRSSQQEKEKEKEKEEEAAVDTCRVCKLRLEANRKYTHERFLVCAQCNAKLHPGCTELGPDTVRKCREYAWQCGECKRCGVCAGAPIPDRNKMVYCDLCDRAFHTSCLGLQTVPSGRWHCVECAICKSCGARSPAGLTALAGAGEPSWHHQTRRGPGGHKVYSHSLCTPCARAYRIGRYCPLCERSFIGPKGTMQLVICKLCDRQLHQECVRQTVSALDVLDYTCADCRRGGITSRAAAVRAAPRTIATLFMAKRRFNKYAHRQYLESRARDQPPPAADDDSHD